MNPKFIYKRLYFITAMSIAFFMNTSRSTAQNQIIDFPVFNPVLYEATCNYGEATKVSYLNYWNDSHKDIMGLKGDISSLKIKKVTKDDIDGELTQERNIVFNADGMIKSIETTYEYSHMGKSSVNLKYIGTTLSKATVEEKRNIDQPDKMDIQRYEYKSDIMANGLIKNMTFNRYYGKADNEKEKEEAGTTYLSFEYSPNGQLKTIKQSDIFDNADISFSSDGYIKQWSHGSKPAKFTFNNKGLLQSVSDYYTDWNEFSGDECNIERCFSVSYNQYDDITEVSVQTWECDKNLRRLKKESLYKTTAQYTYDNHSNWTKAIVRKTSDGYTETVTITRNISYGKPDRSGSELTFALGNRRLGPVRADYVNDIPTAVQGLYDSYIKEKNEADGYTYLIFKNGDDIEFKARLGQSGILSSYVLYPGKSKIITFTNMRAGDSVEKIFRRKVTWSMHGSPANQYIAQDLEAPYQYIVNAEDVLSVGLPQSRSDFKEGAKIQRIGYTF